MKSAKDAIGVGVIGAGGMGSLHTRNAATRIPGARVVAVADPLDARARVLADELAVPRAYTDPQDLIDDEDVRIVVIASPLPTHTPWVEAAARAGKDVFCEKPLGVDLAQATSAVEAVRAAGIRLQIGFNRRFDRTYVHAKQLIDSGAIGEPVIFKAITRDRLPPPLEYLDASRAGMLVDTAVHDYDLARWLMADEVAQVQAFGGLFESADVAEQHGPYHASVNLKFRRGGVGNAEACWAARYGDDVRTEIVGTEGGLLIGDTARLPVQVLAPGALRYEGYSDHFDRFGESYHAELSAFIDAVAADRPTVVDEHDGLRAVEIAVAARRSLDEGGVPVDLPLEDETAQ
jgi:predicted dehydrogenase